MAWARQGIVRVKGNHPDAVTGASICTGWLITEELVATVAYGANDTDWAYTCDLLDEDGKLVTQPADLLAVPAVSLLAPTVRLLRLHQPMPTGAVLRLRARSSQLNEPIIILQFPSGSTDLSFSFGQITQLAEGEIQHSADTLPGSGGAPLFSLDWEVLGFHHSANKDLKTNKGSTLSVILSDLRDSSVWPAIVRHHRLADVSVSASPPSDIPQNSPPAPAGQPLLRAAVLWEFDPTTFSATEAEILENMVFDPEDQLWVLRPDDRQRLLRASPSLEALRQARGDAPAPHLRQTVLDRLLQGAPFDLTALPEPELPYWLQAVRWFEEIIPGLPSPEAVSQALERRRLRSQFEPIAGPSFRGRAAELRTFDKWFHKPAAGPLVVSGIGGVGKSSLVARFALSLPADTLLLWLDFDRADLAPDDILSVLTLLDEQATLQLPGFRGPDIPALARQAGQYHTEDQLREWLGQIQQQAPAEFGRALRHSLAGAPPPLLVLDGFEVAQHDKQHDEIWDSLGRLLAEVPELRVIVSGRAEVRGLKLLDRKSQALKLAGISAADADAWLLEKGIVDEAVRQRVIAMADGVPLKLHLAVRLANTGADLQQLPQNLEQSLVTGYLYDRILDRVIGQDLKATVEAALVLRKLTPLLLQTVLSKWLPTGMTADQTFDQLGCELAVVDPNAVFGGGEGTSSAGRTLWIRPDVRTATLRLLESANAARVTEINHLAAAWYATQALDTASNRAEYIYHLLRSGDVTAAENAWQDDCIPLLLNAADDLTPNSPEQKWLKRYLRRAKNKAIQLRSWEQNAYQRIKRTQSRGLERALGSILAEQKERSKYSPLGLYDAWARYAVGDLPGARDLLQYASATEHPFRRDQLVLAAQLATLAKDAGEADRLLALIDHKTHWRDRPDGNLEALAVRAARIRLAIDMEQEQQLIDRLTGQQDTFAFLEAAQILTRYDVVLPRLQSLLEQALTNPQFSGSAEYMSTAEALAIPHTEQEVDAFKQKMAKAWEKQRNTGWQGRIPPSTQYAGSDLIASMRELAENLARLSRRREQFITADLFLSEAAQTVLTTNRQELLSMAISITLFVFNGLPLYVQLPNASASLNSLLLVNSSHYLKRTGLAQILQSLQQPKQPADHGYENIIKAFMADKAPLTNVGEYLQGLLSTFLTNDEPKSSISQYLTQNQLELTVHLLYSFSPQPLEMLCRRILSLPDSFRFTVNQ